MRVTPAAGAVAAQAPRDRFDAALLDARSIRRPAGIAARSGPRAKALAASRGSTDFGEYFVYFSFFLVASALVLAALFFRLGVEQRAREVGLLRAVGFSTPRVRRLFAAEGLLLAVDRQRRSASPARSATAPLMMAGLRTWWSGAVGTTALTLHVSPISLVAGAAGAMRRRDGLHLVDAARACADLGARRFSPATSEPFDAVRAGAAAADALPAKARGGASLLVAGARR